MIIEMNEMTDGVGGQKGWEFWGHSTDHFKSDQSYLVIFIPCNHSIKLSLDS